QVRVDEPRKQCGVAEIDEPGSGRWLPGAGRVDVDDAFAVDEHQRVAACGNPVEQAGGRESRAFRPLDSWFFKLEGARHDLRDVS
ncbi:MAG TPA: hypothetical protein VKP11_03030, partial [Frankiaceae bacterium]|nr:hypothetical protein [Frankiaceae bacterium]